ncbi:hypothetical protein SESBI_03956 [Sesbania bispinosa]|nr:hypothetical protein SESBI_03956 [Sesbania bispinosa]
MSISGLIIALNKDHAVEVAETGTDTLAASSSNGNTVRKIPLPGDTVNATDVGLNSDKSTPDMDMGMILLGVYEPGGKKIY